LHQESDNCVGVFKDELAGWFKDMNKYREGSDLEFWLSCWSGKAISLNRKTAKSSFVDKPLISVLGGIQPSILNSFYTEDNNLLQYTETQKFNSHYDGGSGSKRTISPILYLNDDYIGGEIEFVNFNIKIKPKSGSLILFPSNYAYRHTAHPVTSGTKYAIVTWIHDRKNE
jgi:Rps23 Pro-64 3,4-dihydroxylase Tpa1-like proline 4-hydroxylase